MSTAAKPLARRGKQQWTKVLATLMVVTTAGVAPVWAQLGSLDTHLLSTLQGRRRVQFEQKWGGGSSSSTAGGARHRDARAEARGRRIVAAGRATTKVGPISTRSVAPVIMARNATRDASVRRTYAKTYAQWLQLYPKQARANRLDPNDLADTITACVMTCYTASTGKATTSEQGLGVRRKVRSSLLSNAEIQGSTSAQKQQLRDTLGIITVGAVKGLQGTPTDKAETRRAAERMFTFLVGYAPDRARATANGWQPR